MDTITTLLQGLNLRAKLIYAGGVCGRWAIDHNSGTDIWFHLLTKGAGWIHSTVWTSPLPLAEGDLILFLPHAEKHYLSYSPDELEFDADDARKVSWAIGSTAFVCGLIELGLPKSVLWNSFPAEIVIRREQAGVHLADLTRMMITESQTQRFGQYALIERLCDGLFILVIRHCIEQHLIQHGVFAAVHDGRLEMVLSAIYGEPWRDWTLLELARHACISKAALTKKFRSQLGCSPMEHLLFWRMQIATGWLREPGMTIERVAERCGYDSVSAFSRAFKRSIGESPGTFRRKASGTINPKGVATDVHR
jgi:AraC family transcriptional regulator, activator of mtrCDE